MKWKLGLISCRYNSFILRINYQCNKIFYFDSKGPINTDKTLDILKDMQKKAPRLKIINMTTNQGKGMGLTMGAMAAKGEYLVCIDADALLDTKAVKYFMWHFLFVLKSWKYLIGGFSFSNWRVATSMQLRSNIYTINCWLVYSLISFNYRTFFTKTCHYNQVYFYNVRSYCSNSDTSSIFSPKASLNSLFQITVLLQKKKLNHI